MQNAYCHNEVAQQQGAALCKLQMCMCMSQPKKHFSRFLFSFKSHTRVLVGEMQRWLKDKCTPMNRKPQQSASVPKTELQIKQPKLSGGKNINNPDVHDIVVTRNGDKSSETVSMRTCRIALLTPIAEVFIMASRSTRGATTRNLIANLALRS